VAERLAFGGVIDTVRIDPAEIRIQQLFGRGAVAARQSFGDGFIGLDDIARRRRLREHHRDLRRSRDQRDRKHLFHGSSYRLNPYRYGLRVDKLQERPKS